jgi:hypothetical protein
LSSGLSGVEMKGKVIDVVVDVADREKFALRHKPLDFLGYVGLRT